MLNPMQRYCLDQKSSKPMPGNYGLEIPWDLALVQHPDQDGG